MGYDWRSLLRGVLKGQVSSLKCPWVLYSNLEYAYVNINTKYYFMPVTGCPRLYPLVSNVPCELGSAGLQQPPLVPPHRILL